MWRVIAAGSSTGTVRGFTSPFGARFTTVVRKFRLSALWFGAETRVRGSLETVLWYQLNSALPSSPRWFFGCGNWFVSTLTTGPTTRTVRPRFGTSGSGTPFGLGRGASLSADGSLPLSSTTLMAIPLFGALASPGNPLPDKAFLHKSTRR